MIVDDLKENKILDDIDASIMKNSIENDEGGFVFTNKEDSVEINTYSKDPYGDKYDIKIDKENSKVNASKTHIISGDNWGQTTTKIATEQAYNLEKIQKIVDTRTRIANQAKNRDEKPSLNNYIKEVTDDNKIIVGSYRTGQTWESDVSPQEADLYRRELERTGVIETMLYKENHQEIERQMVTPIERELEPDVKIAKELNFLTDKNGNNHYERLKNNVFECKSIAEKKNGRYFTDYSIELEDNQKNNFQYTIRSEKNKAEIKNDWSKGMSGEDWLNQDIKNDVLRKYPERSIDNPVTDKPAYAKDFENFVQDRPAPQQGL